jgi:hypothetical protein
LKNSFTILFATPSKNGIYKNPENYTNVISQTRRKVKTKTAGHGYKPQSFNLNFFAREPSRKGLKDPKNTKNHEEKIWGETIAGLSER